MLRNIYSFEYVENYEDEISALEHHLQIHEIADKYGLHKLQTKAKRNAAKAISPYLVTAHGRSVEEVFRVVQMLEKYHYHSPYKCGLELVDLENLGELITLKDFRNSTIVQNDEAVDLIINAVKRGNTAEGRKILP